MTSEKQQRFCLSDDLTNDERFIWRAVFIDQLQRNHKDHAEYPLTGTFTGGRVIDAVEQADAVIRLLRKMGGLIPINHDSFCYLSDE